MRVIQDAVLRRVGLMRDAKQIRGLTADVVVAEQSSRGFRKQLVKLAILARQPRYRRVILLALWIFSVFCCVMLSAVVIAISRLVSGTYQVGAFISVFLWAFFFGGCTLFFGNQKLIITIFGAVLGIGASDLTAGAGLISKATDGIKFISGSIKEIIGSNISSFGNLVSPMVWSFFIVYVIVCLPAFFLSDTSLGASSPHES